MEEDDYFLKWEKHHNAFVSVFDYLYKHNILVDCTLAAEEKCIKAHRIVLMACSPYLQKVLCEHSDNYPIVFFDIKFAELEAIVNFCYRGEVKIPFNELEGFIEAATLLQIKGLCGNSDSDVVSDNSEKNKRRLSFSDSKEVNGACKKKKKASYGNDTDNDLNSEVMVELNSADEENSEGNGQPPSPLAMVSVKSEPEDLVDLAGEVQGSDNSDVDSDDTGESSGPDGEDVTHINDFLNSSSTILFPWTCNRCGEAFGTRAPYEEHRRNCARLDLTNHPWKCHKCPNAYKNKKDLVRHLIYCGNDTPRLYCNRCGNSYKYERGLKRHQKYCGTDVKPLKCPQCEKTYKYKRGLRRHQRRCGIAEALQFLAGKGVTPVVVTKRSLGMPRLGDLAKSGLPLMPTQLAQLTQISALEKKLKITETPEPKSFHSLETSLIGEASVCLCGKVYKYKKSYDKHIASCVCSSRQSSKPDIDRNGNHSDANEDEHSSADDEDDDYEERNEQSKAKSSVVDNEEAIESDDGDEVVTEKTNLRKNVPEDGEEEEAGENEVTPSEDA